jgi:hypothetical protein
MYCISAAYACQVLQRFDQPKPALEMLYSPLQEILTSELPLRESRKCGGCLAYPPLALEECSSSQIQDDPQSPNHHAAALTGFGFQNYTLGD